MKFRIYAIVILGESFGNAGKGSVWHSVCKASVKPARGEEKMTTQNLTLLNAMVQKMDWVEERQKILAQNIANADTPGYAPQDLTPLNFKTMLADVGRKTSLHSTVSGPVLAGLATTDSQHLSLGGVSASAGGAQKHTQKQPYEVAPAGNAVVLEEQVLKMNENYTEHRFITNLYQKNIDMLKTAIKSQ